MDRSYPALLLWSAIGYVILTCILTWPLALHLQTHLLGSPGGDTGVYVWNLWIFRHEILRHGHLPFSTEHIFAYSGGADFSLHNYTPIAGLLGMPLIASLGVVGAFNVVLLAFVASSGLATFVLARRLGLAPAAAWIAGAVFMASPVLTARETAHLSLVTAAPLPLFLWALLRALESKRIKDAVVAGSWSPWRRIATLTTGSTAPSWADSWSRGASGRSRSPSARARRASGAESSTS